MAPSRTDAAEEDTKDAVEEVDTIGTIAWWNQLFGGIDRLVDSFKGIDRHSARLPSFLPFFYLVTEIVSI